MTRIVSSLSILGIALVALTVATALQAQDSDTFSQHLVVGETSLLIDPTRALSESELQELTAGEILVLIDDIERRVTRIDVPSASPPPAGASTDDGSCPWSFLVYVDTVLGNPATVAQAALTVGQRTDRLTEMGCVDIVVADPLPRTILERSRAPRLVEKALVDVAERARKLRDADVLRAETTPPARDYRDRQTIRAQWDRLIDYVAARRSGGPRALLLVTDGFRLSASDLEVLSGRGSPRQVAAEGGGLADIVMDTAQTLSSYGWLTIALPVTNEERERPEPAADDFESFRQLSEGRVLASEKRWVVNFFGSTRRDRATAALDDRLYEAYRLPDLAPLRALAEATAGGVARHEKQLDDLLDRLGSARVVWFDSSEPHDGRVRRLQVRLVSEDTFLRSPWWKRSSTPHLVAESRLRRLLAGESLDGRLTVSSQWLRATPGADGSPAQDALELRVAPADFLRGESIGHVRISVGFLDAAGVVAFEHSIDYSAQALGDDWRYPLPVAIPEGTVRLVVGVEDLSLEQWGALLLDVPGRGASQ